MDPQTLYCHDGLYRGENASSCPISPALILTVDVVRARHSSGRKDVRESFSRYAILDVNFKYFIANHCAPRRRPGRRRSNRAA